MSLFQGEIEGRVMKVIKTKIAAVEKEYVEGCGEIDTEAEAKKNTLADHLVESVVGKIL